MVSPVLKACCQKKSKVFWNPSQSTAEFQKLWRGFCRLFKNHWRQVVKCRVHILDAKLIKTIDAVPRYEARNSHLSITTKPRRRLEACVSAHCKAKMQARSLHLSITAKPRRKAWSLRLSTLAMPTRRAHSLHLVGLEACVSTPQQFPNAELEARVQHRLNG